MLFMPPNQDMQELLRLTRENNRMLHKIRRNAIWGGIIKFVLYGVVLVAVPLWFYAAYLGPMMGQVFETYQQVQGTGDKAQAQFGDLQKLLKQFQNKFPYNSD